MLSCPAKAPWPQGTVGCSLSNVYLAVSHTLEHPPLFLLESGECRGKCYKVSRSDICFLIHVIEIFRMCLLEIQKPLGIQL